MIFDDGRRMLRLTVIDTGFFDEDMTFELFGDEGEPDADGIRRVPDVKAILERAFGALEDPETNQGHVLHAAWALAEPGDPAHDEATRPMTRRAGVRRAGTSTGPHGRWTWAPSAGTASSTRRPIRTGGSDASGGISGPPAGTHNLRQKETEDKS